MTRLRGGCCAPGARRSQRDFARVCPLSYAHVIQDLTPAAADTFARTVLAAGAARLPDEAALRTIATAGPPLIDETTEALNTIVAALQAAAAKADDV